MLRLILPLTCSALLLFTSACSTKTQTIRFLEKTELQVPHLPGIGKLEGKHCANRFLFLSLQVPRLDKAIKDALSQRQNKFNALADAEIIHTKAPYLFSGGLLGSTDCVIVIGRPILLAQPATPKGVYKPLETPDEYSALDWGF